MPLFDFQSLLWWGLPLVSAPILIHLINLLRHRRVDWAAMDFLLASQKKFKTRVLLKQLLLLLLRVAAVLGIVLAMAGLRWSNTLAGILGGARTSHVVLLDDSFSMGDSSGDGVAFERGRKVVDRIVSDLLATSGQQELAVGRFSKLSLPSVSGVPPAFDFPLQLLSPDGVQEIRASLESFKISETDCGPRKSIASAIETLGRTGSNEVLWLISDFRVRDWSTSDEVVAELRQLSDSGVRIHLVDCAVNPSVNLSISQLEPLGGVAAAGVIVPFEIAVRNNSLQSVRDVAIELREDGSARPGVRIREIPPGDIVYQRFDTRFDLTGDHVVEARINDDAVSADNKRISAVNVVDYVDVLLIDGSLTSSSKSNSNDAFFLSAALAPGAGAPTGLRPRIEPVHSLSTLTLNEFTAVWLLDVERLESAEIQALEAFSAAGGGVVFFMGPKTNPSFYNESLYRKGEGIFPVPLAGAVDLLADPSGDVVPDLQVEDHPVVSVLSGQRNPLLGSVRVDRYMAVERMFSPRDGCGFRRMLSLRNGASLAVEQPFGEGLVVVVFSTASPVWNNWSRGNPSWVVVMLELENYLAQARRRAESLVVGDPVSVSLQSDADENEVDFIVPPQGSIVRVSAEENEKKERIAILPSVDAAGRCEARWRSLDGSEKQKMFAINVNPSEGDLARMKSERLEEVLAGVSFSFESAENLQPEADALAGVSLLKPLLYALFIVLVAEQLLAYSASYHPRFKLAS